ncbi:class I SAM-dependent methyltransferase [Oleispirillum naphthae]|uniref:class I SAM-dependent methyltransferase n=1 Tax=Oleispirillum naphthae TaxID=2838853 RepID=UPI0030823BC5
MAETPNLRFEFGKNWLDFIRREFSQEKIDISKRHILEFMRRDDLAGLSFLDIGCGSGLHSIAAHQSGANPVRSFDYDPTSVQAARYIQERTNRPENWSVEQGSVLDEAYMDSLPRFDVVYSWGVLHHTGDVWRAVRNAAGRVKPGGLFYIALYSADVQIDPPPQFWLDVKKKYVSSGPLVRRYMELWYVYRFQMSCRPWNIMTPIRQMIAYKKNRGMSMFTDIRDWLGGWPMEFVYDKDVVAFCERLGLELKNIKTGEACTEFLFAKTADEPPATAAP